VGDHSGSADVGVPASQLFDYLSKVTNLPRYFTAMTSAEPAGRRRDRPDDPYAGLACDHLASAATWSHSSGRAASSSAPAPIR